MESKASLSQQRRQIEFWGEENQKKLYDSHVLILGSNILGQMVLGCCAGLGIGNITLMDNSKSSYDEHQFLYPTLRNLEGLNKKESIYKTVSSINDNINLRVINSKFSKSILDFFDFKPKVIIDAQNDRNWKNISLDYALKENIKYISSYVGRNIGAVSVLNKSKKDIEEILSTEEILDDRKMHSIPSGVCTGVICDELRKMVFSLDNSNNTPDFVNDAPLKERFVYNLANSKRNNDISDILVNSNRISKSKVLVAGAGAIGNYVALNLALSGFKNIDILDFDTVVYHNLARQILFYGEVGNKKAIALSKRIKEISDCKSKGLDMKLNSDSMDFIKKNKYDLIFGCFDNQNARYELSDIALNLSIPYIDGATSPTKGDICVYSPGDNCIKCKKSLEKKEIKNSCIDAPDPSVVIPNIAIGSLMVGEAHHALEGKPLKERLVFDTSAKKRIYFGSVSNAKSACQCTKSLNDK